MTGNSGPEVRLIVLLFGPPGCGKGTQAVAIASHFEIPSISTGDLFRAETKAGTAVGRRVRSVLAQGCLVGDDIVNEMVASRVSRPDCAHGFLLDGYPRTVAQARYLSSLLKRLNQPAPLIIHLDVPERALIARLAARRQCPQCRRVYNVISAPPRIPGLCDADGAELFTREDDREAVIRERLKLYEELTGPILAWYGQESVHRIDGNQASELVRREIARLAQAFAAAA
jgi:adenylate kinase